MKPATHVKKNFPKTKLGSFLVLGIALVSCTNELSPEQPLGFSIRFAHLEDYAWRDRRKTGQPVDMKSEAEREALLTAFTADPPDLIVLRGLGSKASLLHLRDEFAEKELVYPETFYIPGKDSYHGIGFLSKTPFLETRDLGHDLYRIKDREYNPVAGGVRVTTEKGHQLWIWNSQPPDLTESYERRRNEIRLLAAAIRSQLKTDHQVLLSLDSREDPDSPMFRMLEEIGLKRIVPLDQKGDSWTYRDPKGILYVQDQWLMAGGSVAETLSEPMVFDSPSLRKAGKYRHQGVVIR